MIGKLNHVALAVPDLEKAAQTYRKRSALASPPEASRTMG